MTVDYSRHILNQRNRNWIRLLTLWKGSLYKLVWPNMIVYFTTYFILSFYYRTILFDDPDKKDEKKYFVEVVHYCRDYANAIPLSLILAFYVNLVVQRWWKEFSTIPWPDGLAFHITTMVQGSDERSQLYRRTMMRYINLSWILLLGMVSSSVKLRFPTLEHYVQAGLLLPHEKIILETLNLQSVQPKYWVPLGWVLGIASRARKENRIGDNLSLNLLVAELNTYRTRLGDLLSYDWIQIPLVYTQAVIIATYSYFFANVMGKQFLKDPDEIDLYVPVFHFFEFFFYMGWVKVAESLMNPFGNDDDDFEINYFIDRNFQTSYFMVDELVAVFPTLVKDVYWDCYSPEQLPYTEECMKYKLRLYHGTSNHRIVKHAEDQLISRSFKKKRTKEELFGDKDNQDQRAAAAAADDKIERKRQRRSRKEEEEFNPIDPAVREIDNNNAKFVGKYLSRLRHTHNRKMRKKDLFNRECLMYKTIFERKKLGSLQTSGYWGSITGPVLADRVIYYETEFHKRFARPDQPLLLGADVSKFVK